MRILTMLLGLLMALPVHAAVKIFACEPEWAALAGELGATNVYSATSAAQNPHYIDARPSLIAKVRNADLVVCTGLELEAGWLPALLRQAANSRVLPGQPGYFEAGMVVARLDIPARVDRSAGDVHALGNPHIQHDPRNIARVAAALAQRLAEIDPANAAGYQTRQKDFVARWTAALARWQQQAAPLKGVAAVVNHKGLIYLFNWLEMREAAALEPKPGVDPSAAHLNAVLLQLQRDPAKLIVRTNYEDGRAANWLSERTGLPSVVIASTIDGTPQAKDLFALFDDNVQRLLAALK